MTRRLEALAFIATLLTLWYIGARHIDSQPLTPEPPATLHCVCPE